MRRLRVQRLELDVQQLKATLQQARSRPIDEQEYGQLDAAVDTLQFVSRELESKSVSINRLRKLLFGARTEKTRDVLGEQSQDRQGEAADAAAQGGGEPDEQCAAQGEHHKKKRKGHGRNGAAAYWGAEKVRTAHPTLKRADPCPKCPKGKVYPMPPKVLVLLKAQAPVQATVHEADVYRCNLCGELFHTAFPVEPSRPKYDQSVGAMIGLLKYGTGFPFYRLDKLQSSLGIPLPASTQWDIVYRSATAIAPALEQLIIQGAQGQVMHNDDTSAKILTLMGKRKQASGAAAGHDGDERTGIFTSAIVSKVDDRSIALFFTGRKHAGENLEAVLAHRACALVAPIQMCDALTRNLPGELETILCNCLSHARRRFVDVTDNFPDECRHVLEALRDVYANDDVARQQQMSPIERLRFHQRNSGARMGRLKKWMRQQLRDKLVEPNSGLGEAIGYMLEHWPKLIRFLRVAGAPLDNNLVERALKKAILSRKNSYFYKTETGARVGDLFMSLIHTCELNGANPFDYLVALLRHSKQLSEAPAQWMPWNYHKALERLAAGPGPPS